MERIKLSKIKANPNNPRIIRDEKFKKLVKSIKEFPEMLEARPVVVNPDMVVLGGNMRLKALREAGVEEAPVYIASWDEVKQKQFIIKDNVGFGEWDWDMLANEWDEQDLGDWGLDVWQGHSINDMSEDELDLTEEFDPIGTASGLHRVVFLFDGEEEAESYLNSLKVDFVKRNMAWQVDLSTPST
jgi:hypothetical protein